MSSGMTYHLGQIQEKNVFNSQQEFYSSYKLGKSMQLYWLKGKKGRPLLDSSCHPLRRILLAIAVLM